MFLNKGTVDINTVNKKCLHVNDLLRLSYDAIFFTGVSSAVDLCGRLDQCACGRGALTSISVESIPPYIAKLTGICKK